MKDFDKLGIWMDGDGDVMYFDERNDDRAKLVGVVPSYGNVCCDFVVSAYDDSLKEFAERSGILNDLGMDFDTFLNETDSYFNLDAVIEESAPDKAHLVIMDADYVYERVVPLDEEEASALSSIVAQGIENCGISFSELFNEGRDIYLEILPRGIELDEKVDTNGIMGIPMAENDTPYLAVKDTEIGRFYAGGVSSLDEPVDIGFDVVTNPIYGMEKSEIINTMHLCMETQPLSFFKEYEKQINFAMLMADDKFSKEDMQALKNDCHKKIKALEKEGRNKNSIERD